MIRRKKNPAMLGVHAAIVAGTAVLALGAWPLSLLAILVVTHLAMDAIKVFFLKDALGSFALDQIVHLGIIAGLASAFPEVVADGWWAGLEPSELNVYFMGLCLMGGLILSLHVGAIIIRKATIPFTNQIEGEIQGLQDGGFYIGCLERALVMLLMLINQPTGVGFLITAKSVLRFGDISESHQRKLTEYIIIGTFMSFGWGLLIAVLTQLAIRHWEN
jgi:hypothetical protein